MEQKKNYILFDASMIMAFVGSVLFFLNLFFIGIIIFVDPNTFSLVKVEVERLSVSAIFNILISFFASFFVFASGVLGLINARKAERAKKCILFGSFAIFFLVLDLIFSTATGTTAVTAILLFGTYGVTFLLICSVVYVVGAIKGARAAGKMSRNNENHHVKLKKEAEEL